MYMLPNWEKAAAFSSDQDLALLFNTFFFFFNSLVPSPLVFKELIVGNAKMDWRVV